MRPALVLLVLPLATVAPQGEAPRPAAELLAAGDTAGALLRMSQGSLMRELPVDVPVMRLLVRAMELPEWAAAQGGRPDYFLYDATQMLTLEPPVLERDSTRWGCTPAACRELAGAWSTARQRETRALALTAHAVLDPRTWADTVARRFAQDTTGLGSIHNLVRGIGVTWRQQPGAPLPPEGSGWREWSRWMPASRPRDSPLPGAGIGWQAIGPRYIRSARVAALVQQRDLTAELSRALAVETSDSGRAVLRFVLTQLGAPQEQVDVLAERLRRGSQIERASARREVAALLDRAPAADSSTVRTVQRSLLAQWFEGTAPWRALDGDATGLRQRYLPREGDAVYLVVPGLLAAIPDAARRHDPTVVSSREMIPTDRPTSTYVIDAVRRVGPFARVEWSYTYHTPGADAAPSRGAFATGWTVDLFWDGTEWRLLNGSGWIT